MILQFNDLKLILSECSLIQAAMHWCIASNCIALQGDAVDFFPLKKRHVADVAKSCEAKLQNGKNRRGGVLRFRQGEGVVVVQIPYNKMQYLTITYKITQLLTIRCNRMQYPTISYNRIQYPTIPYNRIQYLAVKQNGKKGSWRGIEIPPWRNEWCKQSRSDKM